MDNQVEITTASASEQKNLIEDNQKTSPKEGNDGNFDGKNKNVVLTKNDKDDPESHPRDLTSGENLRVFIRVRPAVERELIEPNFTSIVSFNVNIIIKVQISEGKTLTLIEYIGQTSKKEEGEQSEKHNLFQYHKFQFDTAFDMDSTQPEVYEKTAKPAIESILEGYNSTIFAYGQTGTGKTFTMEGYSKNHQDEGRGIIPRSMEEIFNYIEKINTNTKFMVRASYLQIYNENINDLLKSEQVNLNIREDNKKGVYVDGLSEWSVQKPADIYNLLKKGSTNRIISYTKMNDASSRSHAVFLVTVEQVRIS